MKTSSNLGKNLESPSSHQNEEDVSEDVGNTARGRLRQWAKTETEDPCECQEMLCCVKVTEHRNRLPREAV